MRLGRREVQPEQRKIKDDIERSQNKIKMSGKKR